MSVLFRSLCFVSMVGTVTGCAAMEKLYLDLRTRWTCEYDPKQSIGKRYARMDEAGTPFCFTIDGETREKGSVTVRDRDTGQQERIAIDQVMGFLADRLAN